MLPSGLYTGLDSPFSSNLTGLIGGFSAMISEIPSNIGSIEKWTVLERNKPALTDPIGLNPFFRMTCNQWGSKKNEHYWIYKRLFWTFFACSHTAN
jgi:hypothetical protein